MLASVLYFSIIALFLGYLTLDTFENQPVWLEITRKSENELFSTNFEGKCAIKLVHGVTKTGAVTKHAKGLQQQHLSFKKAHIASVKKKRKKKTEKKILLWLFTPFN